jgi:D-alanyl-D-alanine carboxypeptidase (penicillin-binding protein 5/6)
MLRALLPHQEYFSFGNVWMDKFQHPKGRYTEITNTNKLIRFYDGCDGGKTGFTNEAGFCLAATAMRNNLRVISVAIGADTSQNRFSDVKTMFDYAFSNYEAVSIAEKGSPLDEPAKVNGGKQKSVIVTPQTSVYCIKKKGEEGDVTTKICYKKLTAPITTEEVVGELIVYKLFQLRIFYLT